MTIIFKENKPFIEGVSLNDIISTQATPFYIYSQEVITDSFNKLKEALKSEIFFSIKANSNQGILSLMKSLGTGADVVSSGELERALRVGIPPKKIIFEGVGKSKKDIQYAIHSNIRQINIESMEELTLINHIGQSLNKIVNIGIRLNPNIDVQSLDKISTGRKSDKFGISIDCLAEVCESIKASNHIKLRGISCHAGSQLCKIDIFKKIFITMKEASAKVLSHDLQIEHLDLGGGFGVNYGNEKEIDLQEVGALVKKMFDDTPYNISFEPGRYLVAKAGILITKILTTKENGGIQYLITDAGMQTILRPALYQALHKIQVLKGQINSKLLYTIAGPVCESSDIIAKNVILPKQQAGNYIAICDTGAYGAVMASNYNSRGLPAEILVHGKEYALIHKEEHISEIIKKDIIPHWLKN